MPIATCPTSEQRAAFQAGRLNAAEIDDIAAHLERCATCQTAFASVSTSPDSLVAQLRQAPETDPYLDESACRRAVAKVADLVSNGAATDDASPAADTADLLTPSYIGKYQLLEKIGQGGMGVVYKAMHTVLKKIVAVKILPPERLKDEHAVSRFRREIEAAGRLDHPHIVRTFDAEADDGRHFLVMEWLQGEDLTKLVRRRGPLPVVEACDYIRQAALGLEYAHQHQLVHRDVKPSNLILADGSVKVLDLGLALLHDAAPDAGELTSTGQVMGTYDFIAPEQAMASRSVDARADIYGLGCTFYYLLTGSPPFPGKVEVKKLLAHQLEEPTPMVHYRSDVPEKVTAVVAKMMAKKPAHRIGSMRELVDILSYTQSKEIAGSKISLTSQSGRGAGGGVAQRRRRIAIFAVVGLMLLIGCGLTIPQIIIRLTDDKGKVREIPVKPGEKIEIVQKQEEKKPDLPKKPDPAFAWPAAALREGRISAPDLSKVKPRFHDEFADPTSGWIRGILPPQPSGWTLEYGFDKGKYYLLHPTTAGGGGVRAPWGKHSNFAVQVTGRLASPSAHAWGFSILHESDKRDLHVSFGADGKISAEFRGEGWSNSSPFQPFRPQNIKKADEFNTVLFVVRERFVEIYVNSVAICDPLVPEQGLTPSFFNLNGGGDKGARIEFSRFTVWSAEGIPTPQERLAKGEVPVKASK